MFNEKWLIQSPGRNTASFFKFYFLKFSYFEVFNISLKTFKYSMELCFFISLLLFVLTPGVAQET